MTVKILNKTTLDVIEELTDVLSIEDNVVTRSAGMGLALIHYADDVIIQKSDD